MREFVRLLVLIAVAGGAYALWRLYSYPGGWAYAFHPRHAADRNDLDKARRPARTLAREAKKELDAAHAGIERANRRQRAGIRSIEREIHKLHHPGRGREVAELGGLTIHQHSVLKDEQEIPLEGLTVRLEQAQQQYFIYLTQPDGETCFESYPRPEHDEDGIRRFAVQLENAIAKDNGRRLQATARIAQAEDELAQAKADTSLHDEASAHLAQVTRRQRQDPRPQVAQVALDAAHDRWHKLTGKRPH